MSTVWVILKDTERSYNWTSWAFWSVAETREAAEAKLRDVIGPFSTSQESGSKDVRVNPHRQIFGSSWLIRPVEL